MVFICARMPYQNNPMVQTSVGCDVCNQWSDYLRGIVPLVVVGVMPVTGAAVEKRVDLHPVLRRK